MGWLSEIRPTSPVDRSAGSSGRVVSSSLRRVGAGVWGGPNGTSMFSTTYGAHRTASATSGHVTATACGRSRPGGAKGEYEHDRGEWQQCRFAGNRETEREPCCDWRRTFLNGSEVKDKSQDNESSGHRVSGEQVSVSQQRWAGHPEHQRQERGLCAKEVFEIPEQDPHGEGDQCRNCGARNQQVDLARRLEKG